MVANHLYGLARHQVLCNSVDRASDWCVEAHRFISCRGLRFYSFFFLGGGGGGMGKGGLESRQKYRLKYLDSLEEPWRSIFFILEPSADPLGSIAGRPRPRPSVQYMRSRFTVPVGQFTPNYIFFFVFF